MTHRILILAALLALALPAAAQATSGASYLASRQTLSGGFAEPGGSASVSLTEWAVMGLRAAGKNPARMHRSGGHGPGHFLASHASHWTSSYALERGILAVVAMGKDPRNFGGHDLVRRLRGQIVTNGRIGRYANSTYWGVLALKAAGARIPSRSITYIKNRQAGGGGFPYASSSAPDSNDTAAAVMALRAGGVSCSGGVLTNAYDYLHSLQRSDHGYALGPSDGSDSQSTSWAIQARIRCGLSNTGALEFLAARKRSDGSYNYAPGNHQTPAWVTSQVLPAVNGKAYPIG
ncbi:MAG TPA: hypothetical protein VFH74_11305 [Gaiellales bacterium]|nr:hypothetical protein [Gaiellales bacterium]